MNELIKVTEKDGQRLVSARDLYSFLCATERFSTWIERQFQYGFIENVDYVGCKVFNTLANQTIADFALTIDCAKQISMLQKNEKGLQARKYFIEIEKKYKEQKQSFPVPQNLLEALMLAVEQQKKIILQEAKLKELTPKAEFYDAVTESKNAIDMATCAKVLNMGIGRNDLFELLRQKKILMEGNQPYQKYVDMGLFRVIEQKWTKPSGETNINIKTVVYQKGVDYIRRIIQEHFDEKND